MTCPVTNRMCREGSQHIQLNARGKRKIYLKQYRYLDNTYIFTTVKKVAAILFATIYFLSTVGTVMAMHFCMGKDLGTTIGYDEATICENCHMAKQEANDNGCCKDEHHFVKLSVDHQVPDYVSSPQVPVSFLSAMVMVHDAERVTEAPAFCASVVDPPDIPIYTRNCNFRI
ncbi:MAG: hypothetical protein H3C36_07640 [Chitinophagaceae bacterium]|nr:hypothetical protein [Chitinophagaceae bacterium]MCW5915685.1 hypothetical protein [Chitinophagaceae bacterium]MCZ2396579.1 hypothetical protein [Chitinophagales bacterium]